MYIGLELALLMYNAHPYFPLKNLGKKRVRYTQQNRVVYVCHEIKKLEKSLF